MDTNEERQWPGSSRQIGRGRGMNKNKPMRIFTSNLTNPPRYYASRTYTVLRSSEGSASVRIDGKKWDVTEDIEAILRARGRESDGN